MAIQAQLYSENFGFGFEGGEDMLMGLDDNNLCFVPQQQLAQFDDQFQCLSNHQKNLNFSSVENNSSSSNNNNIRFLPENDVNIDLLHHHQEQQQQQSTPFCHGVSAHIEKQRLEFEHFIHLQNEKLRLAIHQQRKQQISLLLKRYESKTQFLLTQKQDEITRASNRTMELQDFLKKLEIENLSWQKLARENEAMVASLNGTIQRLREPVPVPADDVGSCCQLMNGEKYEYEAGNCKRCEWRKSCVVMLPCRHMCSCRDCEAFLDACPVCRMPKKGSIEALI